nr:M23 family metallopeptidase [Catellatospora sp. TT07R-123]
MATTIGAEASPPRPWFALPFPCGERWQLSTYSGHDDYDIDFTFDGPGGSAGRPILASAPGKVVFAGWGDGGGWHVKLEHGGGWESMYLHMVEAPMVSVGQVVTVGQQLGRVGTTGHSSGPHLHYEQLYGGQKVESYFDGAPSGITTDGSAATGPLHVAGPVSADRHLTSGNCGSGGSLVRELFGGPAWQARPLGGTPVTGSALAVIESAGDAILYTVADGRVYESRRAGGWQSTYLGVAGVAGTAVAALELDGVRRVYVIADGAVYEARSDNAWRPVPTGLHGVSPSTLSAVAVGGVPVLYTVAAGTVHQATGAAAGWTEADLGIPAAAVAAVRTSAATVLYTVDHGNLYQASSDTGWLNRFTGVSGTDATALAALDLGGAPHVYALIGGRLHAVGEGGSWLPVDTGLSAAAVTAAVIAGRPTVLAS